MGASMQHLRWLLRIWALSVLIVLTLLSAGERAQAIDLFDDTASVAEPSAAFRTGVGSGSVLTSVGIDAKTVNFATNIRDTSLAKLAPRLPATARFTSDRNGLQRRLGAINVDAQIGTQAPAPFSIDDVNWRILAQLARDALARAAIPRAKVRHLDIARSAQEPGGPALLWTVEIADPSGELTTVIADVHGTIRRVVLPKSRRPKSDWLDAATIAGAITRIGPTFGADTRIASLVFDSRGGRITIDDRQNGGRPATFDLSADGATRAAISFSLDAMGPRFGVADLAPLDARLIAAPQAEALERLGAQRQAWLESVSIGGASAVSRGGPHAIEVSVRDVAVDSAQAHYAWIVFDFTGRVLDSSGF
jgi:hypothetical protein